MGRIQSTTEEPNYYRKRVLVVCEGKTEYDYFDYFKKTYSEIGKFTMDVEEKQGLERDMSDRKLLVDMAEGIVKYNKSGKETPYHYVARILQLQRDRDLNDNAADIISGLISEINEKPQLLDENGFIIDNSQINKIIERKLEKFYQEKGKSKGPTIFPMLDPERGIWNEEDRVFVVFDRDRDLKYPELRTDEEYRDIEARCKELKCEGLDFRILLSTPMFEFWLLLHHQGDEEKEYIKDTSLNCKNKILQSLRKKEKKCKDWKDKNGQKTDYKKVKGISSERYDIYYKNGFETALKKTEQLGYSFEELLNQHAGSNVGVELEALLSKRRQFNE